MWDIVNAEAATRAWGFTKSQARVLGNETSEFRGYIYAPITRESLKKLTTSAQCARGVTDNVRTLRRIVWCGTAARNGLIKHGNV